VADIKTRDVSRGNIKSLDRAASSMHRMKEQAIRSKSLEIGSSRDSESASSYAQETTEHYAGSSARHAVEDGMELAIRNRQKPPETANEPAVAEERIRTAFKEQGAKTIRDRQSVKKMADAEVLGNAEEFRNSDLIRRAGARRQQELIRRGRASIAKNRQKPPKTATASKAATEKQRKAYAIKRITERNAGRGAFGRITSFGVKGSGKAARGAGRLIRGAAEGAKALLSSLSIGGAAAVVILVIMVLFGAALTFNEDGSYMEGAGDGTIVEVARAELGNVGGAKFWKWYGFNSRVDWCAIFVSWCADQCGYIETGICPKFAVVGDGASWFKTRHRWAGRGYKPNPGDIIFFDYEQDGLLDHVGIVESCDGKIVTTIEGNSGDACRRNSYGVGNSQIAGYGLLLIPGGGSNAQKLVRKAAQLAYPDAPDKAKYHGGEPTSAYAAALERAYPNRSGWGQPSKDGASCDVFVGVCLVDSGIDKGFPRGYRDQKTRLASKTDLYELVVSTTSRDIKESELKDGDIITWEKSNGTVHICIYTGGKVKQASHDKWYPWTTSPGGNLKISGKTVIRVYRLKG
jgi:hypothetical protein